MDRTEYDEMLEQTREKALLMNRKHNIPRRSIHENEHENDKWYEHHSTSAAMSQQQQMQVTLGDTNDALYKIPVFLSYATPFNDLQWAFLTEIISEIKQNLLFPRTLSRSDQYAEPPLTGIRRMVISSFGMLCVAFKRAYIPTAIARPDSPREATYEDFWLSSPYLQLEPAMAFQQGLPLTIFLENGVSMNDVFGGVLEPGVAPVNIIRFDLNSAADVTNFFNGVFWRETFLDWVGEVRCCYNRRTEPAFKCQC